MSWKTISLGNAPIEIIDGDRGKKYPKQDEFYSEEFCLFLSATNVTKTGFKFESCQFVTEAKDNELRKGKLNRNDVVMTTRGTIGNIGYYRENIPYEHIRINSGMVILRVNPEKFYAPFLYYYLRSDVFHNKVNLLRSGAAQPQLPIRDMKALEIPYPEIGEQKRIAAFISSYDDLIENNRRRIQLLEDSARLLYQEWFVHLRFPGHEHVKIVDSVPEGWEKLTVEEVADTIGGGTPSTKIPEYWDDGDVMWFSPTDLTKNDCLVLLDSAKKITDSGLNNSSAKLLPPKTILMTSRASIGYFGLFDGLASTNQGFISLIPKKEYLRWYLLFNLRQRVDEIIGLAGGATFKEINKTTFRAMPVIVPTEGLVEQFYDYFDDIYKQVSVIKKQTEKLKDARDLLLPRLMNGAISV